MALGTSLAVACVRTEVVCLPPPTPQPDPGHTAASSGADAGAEAVGLDAGRSATRDAEACQALLPAPRSGCARLVWVGATASSEARAADAAGDGDACSIWNAKAPAPQGITVDLGRAEDVDVVVLLPEMTPDGAVVHRVELSTDGRRFEPAHRVEASMSTARPVELVLPSRERARFVRVRTEVSPSWVAWREIALYKCTRR